MIAEFVFSAIFMLLCLVWLLFCLVLSLFSLVLPKRTDELSVEKVKNVTTVCGTLHKKQKLSDEEYAFESEVVAPRYDGATFDGYLLIMAPILKIMQTVDLIDGLMLWFVRRWMRIQQFLIFGKEWAKPWEIRTTKICTGIARNLGEVVIFFQ